MTEEQIVETQNLIKRQAELFDELCNVDRQLMTIRASCKHEVDPNSGEVFVRCKFCNTALGWGCSENKKGFCEYDETSENCIFCGNPSERK